MENNDNKDIQADIIEEIPCSLLEDIGNDYIIISVPNSIKEATVISIFRRYGKEFLLFSSPLLDRFSHDRMYVNQLNKKCYKIRFRISGRNQLPYGWRVEMESEETISKLCYDIVHTLFKETPIDHVGIFRSNARDILDLEDEDFHWLEIIDYSLKDLSIELVQYMLFEDRKFYSIKR